MHDLHAVLDSMASKLPKLVLPAYDFKTMKATYRHYAEAVCKANPGMRGAVTKDFVDKGWASAVKEFWPGNQAKREKMFRRVSTRWPSSSFDGESLAFV